MSTYLALDLGAESGRGVLAHYDGTRLTLEEVGRFPTTSDAKLPGPDGMWRWDYDAIVGELRSILAKCEARGPLAGVAVDTWGVDYGLLDKRGVLLEPPVCYRDHSHGAAMEKVLGSISREELWAQTGIQLLQFNTIFQLVAAQDRNPRLLGSAARLLFMPDLLASSLVGEFAAFVSELSMASTSAMLDPRTYTWNRDLLTRVGISLHFLQPIVDSGALHGHTRAGTPVYATAGHDTASAIAAIPARAGSTWAYISSGTWSLVGVERAEPELSMETFRMGLSNEVGVSRTTRLLKNVMGLWLVQECRRSLARGGQSLSYEELTALAASAPAGGPVFDATDPRFLAPADMPTEIRAACTVSGQAPPSDVGRLIRCCLDSLAVAYKKTLADLEGLLGVKFDALHIVGGGTKNRLLNQLAADACGIPVIAGPAEATAAGNALVQMIGSGELESLDDARRVSQASFAPETYPPGPLSEAERGSQL